VSTHALNKTSEDHHIFGVKQKSLHPQKLDEQFKRTYRIHIYCHKETINAVNNGHHAHFRIEGGQLGNANWPVQTKTGID
jgi:hypothetical protein